MDEQPKPPTRTMAKRLRWPALIVALLVALVVFLVRPAVLEWRDLSNRVVCANNLASFSAAWKLYTLESLPPGVSWTEWLVENGHITRKQTIYPSSGLNESNYILVTYPPEHSVDNTTVIAYEPKSNHGGEGGNFLFADGHVSFIRVPAYDELVRSLEQSAP